MKGRDALNTGMAAVTAIYTSAHATLISGAHALESQWKSITTSARAVVLGWLLDGVEENNRALIEGLLIAREV